MTALHKLYRLQKVIFTGGKNILDTTEFIKNMQRILILVSFILERHPMLCLFNRMPSHTVLHRYKTASYDYDLYHVVDPSNEYLSMLFFNKDISFQTDGHLVSEKSTAKWRNI